MKKNGLLIFIVGIVLLFTIAAIGAYGQSTKNETENLIVEIQKFGPNLIEWYIGYKSDVYQEPYSLTIFLQIDETIIVTFAGTDVHDLFRQVVQYRKNIENGAF
jgi:hypothetical protein